MDQQQYEFHYDAGHGWLKVPRQELEDLKIEDQISDYSYSLNEFVYLEEDCDLSIFMVARFGHDHHEWRMHMKDINDGSDSPIRSYPIYHPHVKK